MKFCVSWSTTRAGVASVAAGGETKHPDGTAPSSCDSTWPNEIDLPTTGAGRSPARQAACWRKRLKCRSPRPPARSPNLLRKWYAEVRRPDTRATSTTTVTAAIRNWTGDPIRNCGSTSIWRTTNKATATGPCRAASCRASCSATPRLRPVLAGRQQPPHYTKVPG